MTGTLPTLNPGWSLLLEPPGMIKKEEEQG